MLLSKKTFAALAAILLLSVGVGASQAAPSRSDLESARARLMELERDFQLVSERYNLVHERLESLQVRIARSESEVHDIEQRMRIRQSNAIDLATELYKGGRTVQLEGILSADSLADLDARIAYLETSTSAQAKVFERLAVDRQELDKKIEELDRQQQEALAAQRVVDGLRVQIEDKIASQESEVSRLRSQIEAAERRAAEAARRAAARTVATTSFVASTVAHPEPASNPGAQAAVDAALSQLGKPYQWGASGPNSYDCSGLTMWAWARGGVSLPHNSGMQYNATARVDREDIEPGDLLFFGSPIHHVGMYIGNGQMVEAPYSGAQVRVNSIARSDYVGAGRPN
jgi:cell wall-associated NlpC family hydrolase